MNGEAGFDLDGEVFLRVPFYTCLFKLNMFPAFDFDSSLSAATHLAMMSPENTNSRAVLGLLVHACAPLRIVCI